MAKYISHIRIPVSLFEHPSYLGLAKNKKMQCFSVFVVLMRFADKNTGKCHPRLIRMADMLGVSRTTIYRSINLLIKHKMVIKKRLKSTNLYVINPVFMINDIKNDVAIRHNHVANRHNDVAIGLVLEEPSNYPSNYPMNNNKQITEVDKIVNNRSIDKQTKIIQLASLSLPVLHSHSNQHPYYVQKAIEYIEQEQHDARAVPKHVIEQTITAAVSKTIKNRSSAYKAKVEYNKRNNLDWKGNPKK